MPPTLKQKRAAIRRYNAAKKIQKAFKNMKRRRYPIKKKPLALITHNFVENLPVVDLDVMADTSPGQMFSYHIAQVPDWPNYKGIFRLYKINKVVITFKKDIAGANVYNNNIAAQNQAYALQNVQLSYLRDYTDTTAAVNLEEFKKNSKVVQVVLTNSNPEHTMTLTPAVNKITTYQDDVVGQIHKPMPVFKEWMDTSFDELLHRGLEVHVTGQNLTSKGKIRMDTKIYFSCRNQE